MNRLLEDDIFESALAQKLNSIGDIYQRICYLKYTAGEPIEDMIEPFALFLEYQNKRELDRIQYKKTYRDNVLGNIENSLPIVALAYLLDRRDLLPLIKLLIDGDLVKEGLRSMIDAMLARFFSVNDPTQSVQDYDQDYALYNPASHWMMCKVFDEIDITGNKERALAKLDDYLRDWYEDQELQVWYNSHTMMETEIGYVGYWAFEVAAMVYFLDLDDSSLHKYLYYPKDIVTWIRQKHPISKDIKQEAL